MFCFWQFTDTHLSHRDDPAVHAEIVSEPNQLDLAHSEALIDAGLEAFLRDPNCEALLISGDLTNNGHPDEHRLMLEKLRRTARPGKRIIVITASHDVGNTHKYNTPAQLREWYAEFGPNQAIASFDDGLAFVVQLCGGLRLLCVNDHDGADWLAWGTEQIQQAHAAGDAIIGMTHCPTLPPSSIYGLMTPSRIFGGKSAENTRILANAGLCLMLTGHSHIHNILRIQTPEGNPYWDVNTGAYTAGPGKFRALTFDRNHISVVSKDVPNGEGLRAHFEQLLQNIFDGMVGDFDLFAHSVNGIGMTPEDAYKNKKLFRALGWFTHHTTLGGLGRLLCCRIPKEVRRTRLRDMVCKIVLNMYYGEEHYGPQTPMGQAFAAIGKRLPKSLAAKCKADDMAGFMLSMIYDPTPDDAAEIDL
ncbi:MAG: metallophosphoesterase [Oscillospiraceae bacterium]|jgi:hypothetical protein|nr:metallophosphoesterase [Oscillospiraceae bacterium]